VGNFRLVDCIDEYPESYLVDARTVGAGRANGDISGVDHGVVTSSGGFESVAKLVERRVTTGVGCTSRRHRGQAENGGASNVEANLKEGGSSSLECNGDESVTISIK
jgi:hypothetical protein